MSKIRSINDGDNPVIVVCDEGLKKPFEITPWKVSYSPAWLIDHLAEALDPTDPADRSLIAAIDRWRHGDAA